MAYAVAARKKEMGIRMALGASPGDLLRQVTGQGMKFAVIGLAIGLGGALLTARFMISILNRVRPTDPAAFTLTSVLMSLVAASACFLPAWQASRVDPAATLRQE